MNCWPDGRELTRQDIIDIAIEYGIIKADEVLNLLATHQKFFGGYMAHITSEVRFNMMCEKKLVLRTRIREEKEFEPLKIVSWAAEAKERGLNVHAEKCPGPPSCWGECLPEKGNQGAPSPEADPAREARLVRATSRRPSDRGKPNDGVRGRSSRQR